MNLTQIDPHTIDLNDHEKIHEYISSLPENEIKTAHDIFSYFFPIWVNNRVKKRMFEELVDGDKEYIFQTLLLISYTHGKTNKPYVHGGEQARDDLFSHADNIDRKTIENIITEISGGNNQKIEQLICEFENRTDVVRNVYLKKVEDYKLKHLPKKKKEQIKNLQRQGEKKDKINAIIASHYRNDEHVRILDETLNNYDWLVKTINLYVFSTKTLQINESLMERLVELVSDPSCLIQQNAINVLREEDVPNPWYTHRCLTILEYKDLCENFNDPKKWSSLISKICDNILEKADAPISSIKARKKVITEIIESIYDKRFEVGMLSMYAEIEGLLWDFAIEINRNEIIFDKGDKTGKTLVDEDTGNLFKSDRIRDVIERTAMKNHVDAKFIKDFCEGIYEERNPILHGRKNCFSTCTNNISCIAQKLMTIDYVLDLIIEEFQNNLFEQWDNMPLDVIERTVSTYERIKEE